MKTNRIILATLGLIVLLAGVLFASGLFSGKPAEVTRPGCEWMSTEAQVDTALEKYKDLTQKIEGLGEDITVEKTLACDQEKALVTITYKNKADFQKISDALDGDRYEASVEVIRK